MIPGCARYVRYSPIFGRVCLCRCSLHNSHPISQLRTYTPTAHVEFSPNFIETAQTSWSTPQRIWHSVSAMTSINPSELVGQTWDRFLVGTVLSKPASASRCEHCGDVLVCHHMLLTTFSSQILQHVLVHPESTSKRQRSTIFCQNYEPS